MPGRTYSAPVMPSHTDSADEAEVKRIINKAFAKIDKRTSSIHAQAIILVTVNAESASGMPTFWMHTREEVVVVNG